MPPPSARVNFLADKSGKIVETRRMTDTSTDFDRTLITSAFDIAASQGWGAVSVAAAAREAGLDFATARARFGDTSAILRRLGRLADRAALDGFEPAGTVRETLFDLIMRRFDAMLPMRPGLTALLRALPTDPLTALTLADATSRSMAWLLAASGVPTGGLRGALRVHGMTAVWLFAYRAFVTDESPDLTATMAALDRALDRAERAAGWFEGTSPPSSTPKPFPEDESFADETPATPAGHT